MPASSNPGMKKRSTSKRAHHTTKPLPRWHVTSVDTFLGLTSLGATADMDKVRNAIEMNDP